MQSSRLIEAYILVFTATKQKATFFKTDTFFPMKLDFLKDSRPKKLKREK